MKDIKIFPNYLCISENNRIFALANALVAEFRQIYNKEKNSLMAFLIYIPFGYNNTTSIGSVD